MKKKQPAKKEISAIEYLSYGALAVGGVLLFSSFTGGQTRTHVVPTPPIPPNGDNKNNDSTFGFNVDDEKGYIKYLNYLGYTAGAIVAIYMIYAQYVDARAKIKEATDKEDAELDWNIGFNQNNFFNVPGNWSFLNDGGISWGINQGGAFMFDFKSTSITDFNTYLAANNFTQSAFQNIFSMDNFLFGTTNLFSTGGNWNFTPGSISFGSFAGNGKAI